MTASARERVVSVEHGRIVGTAQQRAVPRVGARIDDAGRVHGRAKRRCPGGDPRCEARARGVVDQSAMRIVVERLEDGCSSVRRQRRGLPARVHAAESA